MSRALTYQLKDDWRVDDTLMAQQCFALFSTFGLEIYN